MGAEQTCAGSTLRMGLSSKLSGISENRSGRIIMPKSSSYASSAKRHRSSANWNKISTANVLTLLYEMRYWRKHDPSIWIPSNINHKRSVSTPNSHQNIDPLSKTVTIQVWMMGLGHPPGRHSQLPGTTYGTCLHNTVDLRNSCTRGHAARFPIGSTMAQVHWYARSLETPVIQIQVTHRRPSVSMIPIFPLALVLT